jgi:predicted DsbA family dithiol-disulfide isomerase
VEVEWVGYELHPETPPGGVALSDHLPDADAMLRYVREFAASFGIADLRPPERLANTRRAMAAARRAREAGRLDAFTAAAYDAYWRRGAGIGSDEEIAAIASAAAVDPVAAVAAASDPALLGDVDAARRAAVAAGVTGIPTLDFAPGPGVSGAGTRVVGCQRYEVLAEAARRAGARRRGGVLA